MMLYLTSPSGHALPFWELVSAERIELSSGTAWTILNTNWLTREAGKQASGLHFPLQCNVHCVREQERQLCYHQHECVSLRASFLGMHPEKAEEQEVCSIKKGLKLGFRYLNKTPPSPSIYPRKEQHAYQLPVPNPLGYLILGLC